VPETTTLELSYEYVMAFRGGVHGGHQLAALAYHGDRGRGLVQDDLDAALLGGGRTARWHRP